MTRAADRLNISRSAASEHIRAVEARLRLVLFARTNRSLELTHAGTLLMHHSKTVHWAGANQSKTRARRALGFVYFGASAKVDEAAKAAYQAKLEADLRAANKI